jgi:hypothetical protein
MKILNPPFVLYLSATVKTGKKFVSYSYITRFELKVSVNIYLVTFEVFSTKKNSGALVRKRTIPTERPPLVGEVSANFSV